ncbi:LexA family transcriptional regulator [Clostridium sp. 19966]|uniref:LexA family protein n=1 Tax=Clostridium sp. 19966 TaxID=2768166 RepID=UPI0028DEAC35|nr:LexA family transcriptional regulator [Clostridium sp. 19966]MDT8717324.1 LexA family transcriptional regulator [Clostridium sp. 19966]
MNLDATEKKIVLSKPFGLSLVKGENETGKSTIATYRALYLKNNYCIYDHEKILIICKDDKSLAYSKNVYVEARKENDYNTLFSGVSSEMPDFLTMENIIDKYFAMSKDSKDMPFFTSEEKESIIAQCVETACSIYKNYNRIKFIKNKNYKFICEEIDWIRSCSFNSEDEYQSCKRAGRKYLDSSFPVKLSKNSTARKAVFHIYKLYADFLKNNKKVDQIEKEKIVLKEIVEGNLAYYTHTLVDDAHVLTKLQLDILIALNIQKAYSSMMLMVDHKLDTSNGAWIVKGRKLKELQFNENPRVFYLKKQSAASLHKLVSEKSIDRFSAIGNKKSNYMEEYSFTDIRYRRNIEFSRDTSNFNELILKDGQDDFVCSKDELTVLPVYSNIAAGEPITINPDLQDTFCLPSYWIKSMKNCFMLKVRGDSMIGAGIENGDYVIIKRQNSAADRDIVAVDIDGSATLKRLNLGNKEVLLMPENEKYEPISITNKQAIILGVAYGIIKRKN